MAGFLLYPDTPAKMETTSHEAFCFQPTTQHDQDKGDGDAQNTQWVSHHSSSTALRQTGRGNNRQTRARETQEDERDHTVVRKDQHSLEMLSQYQKDYPPPAPCRRRTPALPQPDNIGINPAFRFEFSTVQRETYPGWPIMSSRGTGRIRAASSGLGSITSKQ